jgi:uncharacterized FAD-dependent dehydrogenase
MSKIFNNLELDLDEDLQEKLQWLVPNYTGYRILRQSVDARRKKGVRLVYSVEVAEPGEPLLDQPITVDKISAQDLSSNGYGKEKPIIVGTGPAGLFAALRLAERGIPSRIFERGSKAEERIRGINRFWRYGTLDPNNNVCFGEGGAGLYSDGKLITRIKSPHIPYVMDRLVRFGAPEEIRYLANPHVGSDKIRRVIPKIRQFLRDQGCEMHFDTAVTALKQKNGRITGVKTSQGDQFESHFVILATGHSAEDILYHAQEAGIFLEGKSFAMGLRIEHPQKLINSIQYREAAGHPKLGSANYRLADHNDQTGIGVYSFCMCPGGYVLSSGTEQDRLVCNGMSNFHRNSPFANSAIVVSFSHEKLFGKDIFGGLKERERWEKEAYLQVQRSGGTKQLPVQNLMEFMEGSLGKGSSGKNNLPTSSPSGAIPVALHSLLPSWVTENLRKSLQRFQSQMKGFLSSEAYLYGVESRTSCPIRITRDESSLESLSHPGLYPCGEGAGYAGGITSAACDGVRVAEKIAENFLSHGPRQKMSL